MSFKVFAFTVLIVDGGNSFKSWRTDDTGRENITKILNQGNVSVVGNPTENEIEFLYNDATYVTYDEDGRRVFFHDDTMLFERSDVVAAEWRETRRKKAEERAAARLQAGGTVTIPWKTLFPELDHQRTLFLDSSKRPDGSYTRRAKLHLRPTRANLLRVQTALAPYGITEIKPFRTRPDRVWADSEYVIRCKW